VRSAVAISLLLLAACESTEKKAERLRAAQDLACYEASHSNSADQEAHDKDPNYKQTPVERQHTVDSLSVVIQARCDLATRAFNQFMAGR
jgi:hypothetical protein